ncbi:MAG: 30S ribosomal protein S4 [Alphaproteobacteria bacterium]|nr:30S ribosomal protein S4 [Alphaproteobacteria bacterium]
MTKRASSKYKVNRSLGVNLWGRPKSALNRRDYRPGQHGQARRRRLSDYGNQLAAKQKLKAYYGEISERQFRNLYREAIRLPGDTSEHLIGLLERRLSTVVYRMKFAPTVFATRQLINHGHVRVNGKRVNVGGYMLKAGDTIEVGSKMRENATVLEASQSAEREVPDYLQVDHKAMKGTFLRVPSFAEVPYPVQMQPHLVVELYSR